MTLIDRSGEEIARFIDRRKFLKRASITIFSIATASAVNLDRVLTAFARGDNCTNSYCPWNSVMCACQCEPIDNNYCGSYPWGRVTGQIALVVVRLILMTGRILTDVGVRRFALKVAMTAILNAVIVTAGMATIVHVFKLSP